MTITKIRPRSASAAFKVLENLAHDGQASLFRGHRDAKWRIESTLSRHRPIPFNRNLAHDLDETISYFIVKLQSIGITLPFEKENRLARLEYARHYGVPSPLIDFSFSPYNAMFFAFNGVRPHQVKKKGDRAAICCLNIHELAGVWARNCAVQPNGKVDQALFNKEYSEFLNEPVPLFSQGYPPGMLKYISLPASWNRRMLRQLGVFLYDTLDYKQAGFSDLEAYLDQPEIPSNPPSGKVMLTKVLIPHKFGSEIFERLELMGVTATHLYDSHEGAAADVINAHNYSRKTGYTWNVTVPP
jgi:FRG domain